MQKESRDYLEMAYHSVRCFADDGKLLLPELDEILAIAMRDGKVDENEKRILTAIFSRLKPDEMTPEMRQRVDQVRSIFKI